MKYFQHLFRSPVIRLTTWYVLLVMAVSIMFSAIIYQMTTQQIRDGLPPKERFFVQYGGQFSPPFDQRVADLFEERYESVVSQLRFSLIVLNLAVLGAGTLASYFLAKRTLRPIEEALDEQRQFAADASHELRTPLAAMKAEIEVALHTDDPVEHRRVLESTVEEVDKLERLSTSLLTLARHEDTDRRPVFTEMKIGVILDSAFRRVGPLAKRRKIVLERQGVDGAVTGDRDRLTDLVAILLDNAVKYSHEGSAVLVRTNWQPKQLSLAVVDKGIGIAEADLPNVFKRFYRVDTSRSKHKTDGYGLGLSIAKQIVDQHHGTITIASAVDQGTTVTVLLPTA